MVVYVDESLLTGAHYSASIDRGTDIGISQPEYGKMPLCCYLC